jgi:hypothetical protein
MTAWPRIVTIRVRDHMKDVHRLVKEVYTLPELQWESKAYHLWDVILNTACLRLLSVADGRVRLSVWPQPRISAGVDPDGSSYAPSHIDQTPLRQNGADASSHQSPS